MRARIGMAGFSGVAVVMGALTATTAVFAQEPHGTPAHGAAAHAAPDHAAPAPTKPADEKASKEEARKAFGEGKKLFEAGKFAEAVEFFKKADAALPGAAPRLQMAESYEKLNKAADAVAAYKAFLELNPTGKFADKIQTAKDRIAALESTLPALLTVKVSPVDAKALAVTVDGAAAAGEVSLKAGEHKIEVKAEGFEPYAETKALKPNEKAEVAVNLKPLPAPVPVAVVAPLPPPAPVAPVPAAAPTTPPVEPKKPSNVPAFVTLGIAGAGAVLGTTFGILALRGESDFNATPTEDNAQKAERNALIADMSFGVALTFGITGAVLLFSGGEDAADEKAAITRPVFAPFIGPTGGGMAGTFRF